MPCPLERQQQLRSWIRSAPTGRGSDPRAYGRSVLRPMSDQGANSQRNAKRTEPPPRFESGQCVAVLGAARCATMAATGSRKGRGSASERARSSLREQALFLVRHSASFFGTTPRKRVGHSISRARDGGGQSLPRVRAADVTRVERCDHERQQLAPTAPHRSFTLAALNFLAHLCRAWGRRAATRLARTCAAKGLG